MSKKCIWCGGKVKIGFAGVGYYCPHCNEELTEDEVNDNGEKTESGLCKAKRKMRYTKKFAKK